MSNQILELLPGVAIIGGALWLKLWGRAREARDPEFAARVERTRVHMQGPGQSWSPRFMANRVIWVLGAVGMVAANGIIEKYAPVWHLSGQQKMNAIIVVLVLLVIVGFFADRMLNRWLASRDASARSDS